LRGKDQRRAERARSLRSTLTPAEFALWTRIRSRQLGGCKFVRQEPIGRYYVDFVCRERRLIVEVDGGQHSESKDGQRDGELSALGYRVIRIWNNDVVENLEGVLQMLLSELENTAPHPSPLPASGASESLLQSPSASLPSPRERGEGDYPDPADRVRLFYESHPYPALLRDLDRHRELYRNPNRRRAWSLLLWPTGKARADREILVAGCGTSQAAIHALREPDAHVTAIDISETSLRHTGELQRKYGLRNLDLHRLAIEDVGELGRMFDQIVCTGVLHHLPDPDEGLRSLRSVLAADGAMQLMVYATYGRAGIYMMQEYCRLLGLGATEAELRDLGATVGALSSDHPIAGVARRTKDFTYPDALADALLHPQDRAYTVPQVYAWLERCGLSFGRWVEQAPYLPQCGAIARLPHAARLSSLAPPLQHAAVELLRGTMTRHSFIAYRDDRAGNRPPIAFDGDAWRGWVPLRLPWTLCIHDRAPPGSVAVLINRVHTYPDLALPIDAAEERIFAAIDSKRSINQILRDTAEAIDDGQARRFIERLWEYDQIVFDATN
jgi:very-short-patch-repair endonuclease/2-polyprenyl-3-methyl-5-hydroxy-6-metoxy-1,4-benzoquinol methylase